MRKRFYLPYNKYQEPILISDGMLDLGIVYTADYWVHITNQLSTTMSDVESRLDTAEKTIRKLLLDMEEMRDQMQNS